MLFVAREPCSEAFARASLHWSRVRGYHAPEAWVRRVALNYAFSGLRRARYRRRSVERLAQPEEAVPAAAPPWPGCSAPTAAEKRPRMRDEELRRRMEQVAEYGERVVSPPDPALL